MYPRDAGLYHRHHLIGNCVDAGASDAEVICEYSIDSSQFSAYGPFIDIKILSTVIFTIQSGLLQSIKAI